MNRLFANYKNELYLLVTKKKYAVLLILGILVCLGRIGGSLLLARISDGMVSVQSNLVMEILPFFAEILVPLVVLMAVTDLFAAQMQDSTMKAVLLRPVSRFKILTSKVFAAFTVGVIYFIVLFIACVIIGIIFGGSGRMAENLMQSMAAYAVDLIPMFILALMAVVINLLCDSATLSMFLSIAVYAVMKYCDYFVPGTNGILFTSYMQWHKLWIGAALPFGAMISKIGVLLGSGVIFYTAGYYLFDNKKF